MNKELVGNDVHIFHVEKNRVNEVGDNMDGLPEMM
jgi:hypothetical protein